MAQTVAALLNIVDFSYTSEQKLTKLLLHGLKSLTNVKKQPKFKYV